MSERDSSAPERVVSAIKGYTLLHGSPILGPTRRMLAHFHMFGPNDDGVVMPEEVIEFAQEHSYDLIPTSHNSLQGFERALRYKENRGHNGFEMIAGQEYAAIDPDTGKQSHILVLGIETELSPGMSKEKANRTISRLGGVAIAAHPDLGNISASLDEIKALSLGEDPEVRFQGVEVFNASLPSIVFHARKFESKPRPLNCLGEKIGLHRDDLNEKAARFMHEYADNLGLVYFAGSDSHYLDQIDDVILERPADLSPTEAIVKGRVNIHVKNQLDPVTVVEFGKIRLSNVAGKAMQRIPSLGALYQAR